MPRIQTFNITPTIPPSLAPLRALAGNLAWTWHPEAQTLFARVDESLWHASNHNPVALLGRVSQARLDTLAADTDFLREIERVQASIASAMARAGCVPGASDQTLVAYFCAEFGLSEALPIYSGGLGVLAGDHVKAASDLALPFVGIGLAYQEGYFRQYLNHDGWQQEEPYDNDFQMLPLHRVYRPDGESLTVDVAIEDRMVRVRAWEVRVGRARVYLLDTNLKENVPEDRVITYRLYGGDREYRCKQEIVLGMGGFYVLQALGLKPSVYHLNEGHSAFMTLARIADLRANHDLSFEEAREACAATTVFTTHTPVPAGFDIFSRSQLDRFLPRIHERLGIDRATFLRLGAHEGDSQVDRGFNMAYLALRTSGMVNGVSLLHGEVSRDMWQRMWPGLEPREVPIVGLTNGIHTPTWVAPEMRALFDRHLGTRWRDEGCLITEAADFKQVPDKELWQTHEQLRRRLVEFVRARSRATAERMKLPSWEVQAAGEVLDPNALTIGFARRFATYKRATLLLRDKERLKALLTDPSRPVQIIFAGKAHPQDLPAKELIQELVHFARDPAIRKRIAFIEEYDMGVARQLVQGVDVWLNNPRRPKEASGTSGMKVVVNGGLNLSVLDGWWAEAWDGENGWAIGRGEIHEDPELGDAIEARELLELLETSVIPEFHARNADGLPERWLQRVKHSMATLVTRFSTGRMVGDYARLFYVPASIAGQRDEAARFEGARARAATARTIMQHWHATRFGGVEIMAPYDVNVARAIPVRAEVFLGPIPPGDVRVEVVSGPLDGTRRIIEAHVARLNVAGGMENPGWYRYEGAWLPDKAGHAGCYVRLRPAFGDAAPAREVPVRFWE
jgi:starch phosphorylase